MADEPKKPSVQEQNLQTKEQQQAITQPQPLQNAARAVAEASAVAEEMKLDEAPPGGKYIVDDRFVDANGKDLGEAPKGK